MRSLSFLGIFVLVVLLSSCGGSKTGTQVTTIIFGDSVKIDGTGAASVSRTVTLTDKGTYILSGTGTNRSIEVAAPGQEVNLVLAGVRIENENEPALNVTEAKAVAVSVESGTANSLVSGTFDTVIKSFSPLTIQGDGELEIKGVSGHGITMFEDLLVEGGNLEITAWGRGIQSFGSDSIIEIVGGELSIDAGQEGIATTGLLDVEGGLVFVQSGWIGIKATASIRGGTVISLGRRFQLYSGGPQAAFSVSFPFSIEGNTLISVLGETGYVMGFEPTKDFRSLFVSAESLETGNRYLVYSGGEAMDACRDGVHRQADLASGTLITVTRSFARVEESTPPAPLLPSIGRRPDYSADPRTVEEESPIPSPDKVYEGWNVRSRPAK